MAGGTILFFFSIVVKKRNTRNTYGRLLVIFIHRVISLYIKNHECLKIYVLYLYKYYTCESFYGWMFVTPSRHNY